MLEATGGWGADSVIEAVGADATVLDALSCVATGGTVSIVGVNLSMELPFPMGLVFLKSLTVRTVFAPIPGTWASLVPLVQSGRLGVGRHLHPPDGPERGRHRPTSSSTPGPTAS